MARLRQIALDIGRLADELDARTAFDPTVFRYLHDQLLDIAAEIEGARAPDA